MLTYSRFEILSSSQISKRLGKILKSFKNGKIKRIVISKNNQLEAVILPIKEYEKLMEQLENFEHLQIAKIIKDREHEHPEMSLDDVLKQSGISRDEL